MMQEKQRVVFQAALVRIVLGLFALLALPMLYPKLAAQWPIMAGYVGATVVMQVLVWKDVGGVLRSFVSGTVDLAFLTFIVHRVGSVSTVMLALYLLAGVLNALVVGYRVGMALATVGALFYAGALVAERAGWIPYGPDRPAWAGEGFPGWSEIAIASVLNAFLMLLATAVVGFLVQTVRRHEAQLEELSQRDPLTQLYNRRHAMARLEAELARVRRGHPLALVMLDLDGFKRVNDLQGHLRGDVLLQELAHALAGAVRATDVPARYGGDEFLVLLPDTEADQAQLVASRLTAAVEAIGRRFDASRPVTASVGLAIATVDDGAASLIRHADENAYRAKQQGGNRVVAA
jgi:diguanylate cyclase (GGDEF)-like protein